MAHELQVDRIALSPMTRAIYCDTLILRIDMPGNQTLKFLLSRKQAIELEADCLVELKSGALTKVAAH